MESCRIVARDAAGNDVWRHVFLAPIRLDWISLYPRAFELERSYVDDNSWSRHELLERQGKLSHTVADCSMYRRPAAVRSWEPVKGWRTLEAAARRPITAGPKAAAPGS